MSEDALEKIGDIVREVFSHTKLVSFKDNKSLDTLIKRVIKKVDDADIETETPEEDVETFKVGRIQVTKIGEKSDNPYRVVTPGDTVRGDEHSENFHGRESARDQMSQ